MGSNMFDSRSYKFEIDLLRAARCELDILEEIAETKELSDDAAIDRAIWRYEHLWLPLAGDHTAPLTAPLDIEWVWQCHMLSPIHYQQDSKAIAFTVVAHRIEDKKEREAGILYTRKLWQKKYPNESFDLGETLRKQSRYILPKPKLSYDIKAAMARQRKFYYHVSLPHYRDKVFLQHAVLRYKKFLFVKKRNWSVTLAPCYDIDLIWHVHLLHPVQYMAETKECIGEVLNHDDNVGTRKEGSTLAKAFTVSRQIWNRTFDKEYRVGGSMFRGEEVTDKFHHVDNNVIMNFPTKHDSFTIRITNVALLGLVAKYKEFDLLVSHVFNSEKPDINETLMLRGPKRTWAQRNLATFSCKNGNEILYFSLKAYTGGACFGKEIDMGHGRVDTKTIAQLASETGQSEIRVAISDKFTVTMDAVVEKQRSSQVTLRLAAGEYAPVTTWNGTTEHLWGPVHFNTTECGKDITHTANHKILTDNFDMAFTCRVVHSRQLMMSSVQIYHDQKLAVVGHLIGHDHLPHPNQVSAGRMSLSEELGERAILIKNRSGDWGVVIGRWDGFKQGVPVSDGAPATLGNPGYLRIRHYRLPVSQRKPACTEIALPYNLDSYALRIEDAHIDLKSGLLQISTERLDVPELVCLAFSIAVLHVLVIPRPVNWEPGVPLNPPQMNGSMVRSIPSESLVLVKAAGVLEDAPCNIHMGEHREECVCNYCAMYKSVNCGGCGGCVGDVTV